LLTAFGYGLDTYAPIEISTVQNDTLAMTGQIGEMMGDSCYVFGQIASAVPTEGGGVAVLDVWGCDITFFDSTGSFIRSIGGHGEGPGEFLLPIDFTILADSRIAVVDLVNRRVDILSSAGELLNSIETPYAMLPFGMSALADSSFIIYYYSSRLAGSEMDMGFNLEVWDPSGLRDEIWSWRSPYTGADFSFSPGYLVCTSADARVYISEMTDPEFLMERVDVTDGSSIQIISEAARIETDSLDTGYIEPKVFVNYILDGSEIDLESEALQYRPQIGAAGVDGAGRVWIRDGTTDEEKWLIFNEDGEQTGSGVITGIPETGKLRYMINPHGAVAWAPFTEEYPRVFVLSTE